MRKLLFSLALLLLINNRLSAQNCSINAGVSTTICLTDAMKLNGVRSGLSATNSFSKWTQTSGPTSTIVNPDSLITSVIDFSPGTYSFKITNKCKDGIYSIDSVSIIVLPLTVATAGDDTILCPGNSYILQGNKPLAPYETGLWTIISNGVGVTIHEPSNPTSMLILSPNNPGISKLRWTITNINGCSSMDDITITNSGGVSPVNAGPDQTLDDCYSITTCTKLVATNGGTGFGNQIGIWSFISGPTVPTLSTLNNPTTSVCNLSEGIYLFRYTVTGPCANGVDEVQIKVPSSNQNVPSVNANASSLNTNLCNNENTITLVGNNPTFSGEVVEWSQITGPVIVDIKTPNNPSTVVTGLTQPGAYRFKYKINNINSGCSGSAEIRITVYEEGKVNGGPDQILPCNVRETTIPTEISGYGYVSYRIINGPEGAFKYPTVPTNVNKIKGLNFPGTYVVEVSYQFGPSCPVVNDFVNITVSLAPTGSNAGTFQNFSCATTSTQLAGNNPVLTGLGTGKWSQISGPNTATLVNPENYICNIKNTLPGKYIFRWTISGGNNCLDNFDDIVVISPDSSITKANADINKTVCFNSPITLLGNSFRADETAIWTVNNPDGINFSPSNRVATPKISGLKANTTYIFKYTITNSCGSFSEDSVKITTGSFNGPSVAIAGKNQCLDVNTNIIELNATKPTIGSGIWTQIAGPKAMITNSNSNTTTVTNTTNGIYKFVWTVSVNECTNKSIDTTIITISDKTTIANAGPDISFCGNAQILNANKPIFGNGYWSQISGDGSAIIENAESNNTNIKNLTTGSYIFRWTISNGTCQTTYDDIKLKVSSPPSIASAGKDQVICGLSTSTTLEAVKPTSGTGQWAWVSGYGTSPTITNSTNPNAVVTKLNSGSNTFRWTVSGGPLCPESHDDVVVNVSINANAGIDKTLCNLTSSTLKGNSGSKGTWTQISGPNATIIQTPFDSPDANIYGLENATNYSFRYTIPSSSGCPSSYDDINIKNGSPTLIPDAGADDKYCQANSFKLSGSLLGDDEKGTWTILSEQKGCTFSPHANQPDAVLNGITAGTYLMKWTVTNGVCSNSDVKRIDNYVAPTNAYAGEDDSLCFVNNIVLNANTPNSGIGKWSQISGPNLANIDAPNNPNSEINNLKVGTYRFLWTITNYACSESHDAVKFVILNDADVANAGKDQSICTNNIALNANIPTGTNKGIWSQISGPNSATFSSTSIANATISNLIPGAYKFVWKIYNERCFTTDTVEVKVSLPTIVNAGADISVCNQTASISLKNALVSGFTNVGSWSIISGEGTLSNTNPTNEPFNVTFTSSANYSGLVVLRLTAHDNCNVITDDITITVTKAILPINAVYDKVRTDPNTAINIDVLSNDKILVNEPIKLCNNSIMTRPSHGTAMVNNDGTISYKPVNGFLGIDSFRYKICNTLNIKDLNKDGCFIESNDNAWVYITIEGCTMPNSFSPDNDGVNDYFVIPCAQGDVQLNVFNRWGIEVYKNNIYNNDWDGTYNNSPLPDGTYFYVLKYSIDNDKLLTKEGFITLHR